MIIFMNFCKFLRYSIFTNDYITSNRCFLFLKVLDVLFMTKIYFIKFKCKFDDLHNKFVYYIGVLSIQIKKLFISFFPLILLLMIYYKFIIIIIYIQFNFIKKFFIKLIIIIIIYFQINFIKKSLISLFFIKIF